MVRTLKNIFRQDREKFVVPKSVQQAVPILAVWENGIFQIAKNKFARTYKFEAPSTYPRITHRRSLIW